MAASAELTLWVKFDGRVTKVTATARAVADLDVDALRTACKASGKFSALALVGEADMDVYLNDETTTPERPGRPLTDACFQEARDSDATPLVLKVARPLDETVAGKKRPASPGGEPQAAKRIHLSSDDIKERVVEISVSYSEYLATLVRANRLVRDASDLVASLFPEIDGAAVCRPSDPTGALHETTLQSSALALMREVLVKYHVTALHVHDTHAFPYLGSTQRKPDITIATTTELAGLAGHTIVAILELRGGCGTITDSELGQAVATLEMALHENPARRSIFGAVANFSVLHLIKVTRPHEGRPVEVKVGPVLSGDDYARVVEGLLRKDPWTFHGLVPRPMPGEWLPPKHLGIGATATVLAYKSQNAGTPSLVSKLVFQTAAAERELQARVHAAVTAALPPENLENPTVCSVVELAGYETPENVIFLRPEGEPLPPGPLSPTRISQLAKLLDVIHRDARVLHRDLRAPNVALESQRILLLDFGFALPLQDGTDATRPTTLTTTLSNESTRVLQLVAADPEAPIQFTIADERESFVKLVLVLADRKLAKKLSVQRRGFEHDSRATWADALLDIWHTHMPLLLEASHASSCSDLVPSLHRWLQRVLQ